MIRCNENVGTDDDTTGMIKASALAAMMPPTRRETETVELVALVQVVSRWYGGVKLGPDRFKLINNTARTLLEATGYIKPKGGGRRA